MARSKTLLVSAVLLTALLWWLSRPAERPVQRRPPHSQSEHSQPKQSQTTHARTVERNQSVPDEYPQLSLKSQSQGDAVRAYIENVRRDPKYEWKMPIHFYGKVIDQHNDPVVGATAHLQWINLQGKEGVGEAEVAADGAGLFSLEGVKGKRLSVRISKSGYYNLSGQENQTSFEYANPAEASFHKPYPVTPAVFLLRRKGTPEPLIVKSLELQLSGKGATTTVDLMTGKVLAAGGELQVTVWKPTNEHRRGIPLRLARQRQSNRGGSSNTKTSLPWKLPNWDTSLSLTQACIRPTA